MKNLILIKFLLFTIIFNAQTLNTQFGNGGIVTGSFSNNPSSNKILQAAPTSNGKIIILGNNNNTYSGGTSGFLSRIYPSGAIDYSFHPLGYRSCGFYPSTLAIQNDDKIIVSGRTYLSTYTNTSPVVNRYNADGTIDSSFSCLASSLPSTLISSGKDFFSQTIAIQTDGKILVGGYIKNGTTSTSDIDIALFRLNADGSLDTTFNSTGYVIVTNPASKDFLFSVAVQQDGKIVAAGSINSNFSCWKFETNGSPDTTFGTNGIAVKDFGSTDVGRSVALVQSTGDIFVSGVSNGKLALAKFNSTGGLVYSQNTSYTLTLTNLVTSTVAGTVYNIASTNMKYIESTHKILISGTYNNVFTLFEFDDFYNGVGSGMNYFSSNDPNNFSSFLITLSNGNVVTGGSSYNNTNYSMNIGQFDSFNSLLNYNKFNFIQTNDNFSETIELNDGKILAVNNGKSFVKYNANGTKDLSYGINGVLELVYGFDSAKIKKQSDGKILFTSGGSGQDLYRLNSDGTFETYVDPNDGLTYNWHYNLSTALLTLPSTVFDPNNAIYAYLDSFAFDLNGKIYIVFDNGTGNSVNIYYLARLNPDFSFDTSFGTNGISSLTFPNPISYGWPNDLIIQSNGKIVVMGIVNAYGSSSLQLGICRFNTDGSIDNTFNSVGYVEIPQQATSSVYYWPYKMIKLSDDSFIINERKYVTNHYEYDLIKFNSNGEIDTTFGTNGVLNDDLTQISALNFIVLPNNKIIKGGTSNSPNYDYHFKTVCYNSDGTLDTSYGTNGYVTTNVNNFSNISNLLLLQNGNLLASGYSSTITNYLSTLTQYNLNTMNNEEFVDDQNVFVYPNPAKSKVSFDNSKDNYESVVIYNSLGQEVVTLKLDFTSEHIDVNNLAAGIYILNFKNSNKSTSVKLVKE